MRARLLQNAKCPYRRSKVSTQQQQQLSSLQSLLFSFLLLSSSSPYRKIPVDRDRRSPYIHLKKRINRHISSLSLCLDLYMSLGSYSFSFYLWMHRFFYVYNRKTSQLSTSTPRLLPIEGMYDLSISPFFMSVSYMSVCLSLCLSLQSL